MQPDAADHTVNIYWPDNLLTSTIQLSVNTMPWGKGISSGLREAAYVDQSWKGYNIISKQFGVRCSTLRKIIQWIKLKSLKPVGSLPRSEQPSNPLQAKVRPCNAQKKNKTKTEQKATFSIWKRTKKHDCSLQNCIQTNHQY